MPEFVIPTVAWLESNADLLGALGTVSALVTLFFTNGTLILKRLAGAGAEGLPVSVPSISMDYENPDYGGVPSVACLPLRHSGLDDEDFVQAVLDEIIILVQEDREAAAAPRTSVLGYRDTNEDVRAIAARLGVGYILEGSLRENGGIIRLHVQLSDSKGATVWSDRMDVEADYGFATQENLARFVCDGIHSAVVPTDKVVLHKAGEGDPATPQTKAACSVDPCDVPSRKLRGTALILCGIGFLGIGGLHRFYVGRPWTGLLYLMTGGLFFVGTLLDFFLIMSGSFGCCAGHPLEFWSRQTRRTAALAVEGAKPGAD